jgi:hypothetical protein
MRKRLEYVLIAAAMALYCLTAAVPRAHSDPAPVDPALVGAWKASSPNLTWTIRTDGTYTLSGDTNDTGKLQASGGHWTTTSDATQQPANGSYTLHGQNAVSTTGLSGSIDWARVQPADQGHAFGGNIREWFSRKRPLPGRNAGDAKARIDRGLELYRTGKKEEARREWQQVAKMGDKAAVKQAREYLAKYR